MKQAHSTRNEADQALRISRWSIAANLLLAAIKLLAGLLAASAAMISDAVHSASDVGSTLIVMISVRLSNRTEDADHEYGHERIEAIAAILMAVALSLTGLGIGWSGLNTILHIQEQGSIIPGKAALAAAILSIVVKELMYRITAYTARRINSTALMADAWHHRADAFSSIGSLVGVLASRLGWTYGDPLASIMISIMIIKAGVDTFSAAADQLTDKACAPEMEKEMRNMITLLPGVVAVDLLKTRRFASKIYVDVEISADGAQSLSDAHEIAEHVHDEIEKNYPMVKHCMVHVNPADREMMNHTSME